MQKELSKHRKEVIERIRAVIDTVPSHRSAFKQGYSFSAQPFEQQLAIWHYIWGQPEDNRARLYAYFFLEKHVSKIDLHDLLWDTSILWQEQVDDWPLCDSLAKINTKVLETFPAEVYHTLAEWNKSTDLWKRRQSVVSLLYYSRTKKVHLPFNKIVALVEPLLTDKEYYVQKGVGWTLREMSNVYPKETLAFLKEHIKQISAIAFTIAIEKLDEKDKLALKVIRR